MLDMLNRKKKYLKRIPFIHPYKMNYETPNVTYTDQIHRDKQNRQAFYPHTTMVCDSNYETIINEYKQKKVYPKIAEAVYYDGRIMAYF